MHQFMQNLSPNAMTVIALAAMLFCGFAMTRLTKRLRLPNVTAYILTGILLGRYCLNVIPNEVIDGMDFLSDAALSLVAFSIGEFFRFSALRQNGFRSFLIALAESLAASMLTFSVLYFVLHLHLAFCVTVSALAAVTAPTSTAVTIRQTGAKGEFVDTLLQTIALDDIIGLIAFSVATSLAASRLAGNAAFEAADIWLPLAHNAGAFVLGGFFGLLMKWLMPTGRSTDNRLIISIAVLAAFCGMCALFDISPLLGCMSMGTVYINTTDDKKLFKQLGYFSPPILLLFFVRSGLQFDFGALFASSGIGGSTPLVLVAVLYVLLRMAGKYIGAFVGCALTKKSKKTRNYLGLALTPQAGVSIGLAALGARTVGGETGEALQTVIVAAGVLYELIGPALAKLALYLSGAYTDKLEELVPIEEEHAHLSHTEKLILRIKRIQDALPTPHEEEQAFDEAAEEYYAMRQTQNRRLFGRRMR